MTQRINSESYWDARFASDWDKNQGPGQSRFFARVAIELLPAWLFRTIREQQLTVVDWGCAEGDGTDELAAMVAAQRLSGVDFSGAAIQRARTRYPAIRFIHADWLVERVGGGDPETWDVVFSSNTLEHFHQPFEVLNALCARARKLVVLVLPYREHERIEEHHFSFLPDNLPATLSNGFRLVSARAVDCRRKPDTRWMGEQIVLVYGLPSWLDERRLMLSDFEIGADDVATLKHDLTHAVQRSEKLEQALNERQVELEATRAAVAQRDENLAAREDELRRRQQLL